MEQEPLSAPHMLTESYILEAFEAEGYDCFLIKPTTKGSKGMMEEFLRKNHIKHANLDNAERWKRIVRHVVPEERKKADPQHYKKFPFKNFLFDVRFFKHFFAWAFSFAHSFYFQSFLAVIIVYHLHFWSYDLYVKPLPMLGATIPCSKLPIQFHCRFFKFVQDNTYNSWDDIYKYISAPDDAEDF